MRSLTTIIAAIAIALSTCVAVNAAPQGNTSADRQLRQLEARYDTLSNLRYTNAYIEAEKRVIEAKIEKIKHQALSSEPNSGSSSSSYTDQGGSSAAGLEITGPKDINHDPKDGPLWIVECGEFVEVNDDATFFSDFKMSSKDRMYPFFGMDMSNLWNEQLHALNVSVWDKETEMPATLSFEGETISVKVVVKSILKEEFKDTESSSMFLFFPIEQNDGQRIYKALTTKRILSMTIGKVRIPLDKFTDSKVIFRAMLKRMGTKVSQVRNF